VLDVGGEGGVEDPAEGVVVVVVVVLLYECWYPLPLGAQVKNFSARRKSLPFSTKYSGPSSIFQTLTSFAEYPA
jgi:hypothetical protein